MGNTGLGSWELLDTFPSSDQTGHSFACVSVSRYLHIYSGCAKMGSQPTSLYLQSNPRMGLWKAHDSPVACGITARSTCGGLSNSEITNNKHRIKNTETQRRCSFSARELTEGRVSPFDSTSTRHTWVEQYQLFHHSAPSVATHSAELPQKCHEFWLRGSKCISGSRQFHRSRVGGES